MSWITQSYIIDTEHPDISGGSVYTGPFDTKEDAEAWADTYQPDVEMTYICVNPVDTDPEFLRLCAEPLIKKERKDG